MPAAVPQVRAVAFDAVGVLIEPAEPVAETYAAAGRRFGFGLSPREIAERFGAAFARRFGPAGAADDDRAAWRAVVGDVFAPPGLNSGDAGTVDALFLDLWARFAEPSAWRVFDDVPGVLAALRTRGLVCGVASNFDARLHAVLDEHPALRGLAPRVVSGEIGARKPHPSFWMAAAEAFGSGDDPRGLLLADDVANNVDAARVAGWRAMRVERPGAGLRDALAATAGSAPCGRG